MTRLSRRWTATLVLGVAVVTIAACGPPAGLPYVVPDLCGQPGSVNRLVVTRTDAFPQNHVTFSFPAVVTVTDARRVRAVAAALCSLPKVPSGTYNCQVDLGISYRLSFPVGNGGVTSIDAQATGCQIVSGLGPARSGQQLWPALADAIGLPSSSSPAAAFAGPLPRDP
jgi:hypothetical protein